MNPTNSVDSDVELEVSVLKDESLASDSLCRMCRMVLTEPYIRCAVCANVDLCPSCFANGCEVHEHKNDHDYVIIRNEFPLIGDSDWNAKQELELLDVIQQCGFGNWTDVERRIQGKSAEECRMHYLQHYIDNQTLPGLPKIKETRASLFSSELVPYMFKLRDLEEPPRFASDSPNVRLLAGYNAARSDFEVNFDNHAEMLISDLNFDEIQPDDEIYELERALQAAVVGAYNNRLRERARRRKIIRDHGLMTFRRVISWMHRYETSITRPLTERLLVFTQLVDGMDFDYIMEGLHGAGVLRSRITKLLELRENGLTHFHSVSMFKKLSKLRQENERERKQYLSNPEYSWRTLGPDSVNVGGPISVSVPRKLAPPLVIQGLPGYEKLNAEEKELCSVARIVPESYLDYKHLLLTENKKLGYLRLAQARTLLKIDVNKTRKIYDFLIQKGYIKKPTH